jgi:hypothetical protein
MLDHPRADDATPPSEDRRDALPSRLTATALAAMSVNRLLIFLFGPYSSFGPSLLTRVVRQFIYVTPVELVLPPHHAATASVDSSCRHGEPSSEECVVSGASDPIVTDHARPGRQLLVVQQVTASTNVSIAECDKARKSLAIYYSCRFTPADGDFVHRFSR